MTRSTTSPASTATPPTAGLTAPGDRTSPGPGHDLTRLVRGSTASTFGSTLTSVTVSVVAVDVLGVTGSGAGLLAACGCLPTLVLGLYAGVAADVTRRPRRVLVAVELLSGLAVLVAAVLLHLGRLDLAVLLVLELATGVLACVAQALFLTHLSVVAGSSALGPARARLQSSSYSAAAAANALAGLLIRALTPTLALLVDVATYLWSAANLRRIGAPDHNPARPAGDDPGPQPRTGIHRQIVEGIAVVADGPLRPVVAYAVVAQAAFAGAAALKALFLLRTLRLPVELYGVPALAAAGLGALGSVQAARLVARGGRPGRVAVGFWSAGALSALALPSAAGPVPVALAVATLGVAVPVLCGAAANVAVVAIVGERVPQAVLGRVNACLVVAVSLATVSGSLVAGRCADLVGVRTALWGCAALGVAGLALLVPVLTGAAGSHVDRNGRTR